MNLLVWASCPFGHFGIRPININQFVLTDCHCTLERLPILRQTCQAVLSPLSIDSIVLSLLSIMGTTFDPAGKDSFDMLAISNEVLISRQIESTLELTLLTRYTL